MIKSSIMHAGL